MLCRKSHNHIWHWVQVRASLLQEKQTQQSRARGWSLGCLLALQMIQVCFDFYLLHTFHWDLLKKRVAAKLWWSEPSYNLMLNVQV